VKKSISPYLKVHSIKDASIDANGDRTVSKKNDRSWFYANELAQLYGFPKPTSSSVTIGVLSFGGGLVGTVDSQGTYVGDVQTYWAKIGIKPENFPKILFVPVDGAKNMPNVNDGGSTIENMIDLETIGACCPSANLTILFFLGTQRSTFASVLTKALGPTTIQSVTYQPSILSISWGLPELYAGNDLSVANALMMKAANSGISICVATGDNGSNDGVGGTSNNVDFPSCSPYCVAVGGTSLVSNSSTNVYTSATVEKAWSGGGGGFSGVYSKPAWQSSVSGTSRSTPDISSNADPNTGVSYYISNNNYIIGGTSIAAPTVAALFACINLKQFANPLLYALPSSCFHDITTGSNGAYSCKPGYDNCTGFGSMNGSSLAPALANATPYTLSSMQIQLFVGQTFTVLPNPVPTSAMPIAWTSSNPAVASIAGTTGKATITALSPGSATMLCTIQGVTASLSVSILAR
jgi:kumamolisin